MSCVGSMELDHRVIVNVQYGLKSFSILKLFWKILLQWFNSIIEFEIES